jgi:hypothetical protein
MEKPTLSDHAVFYLAEARKWARFIAIVMFVMIGFMILAGFMMGALMDTLTSFSGQPKMPFSGGFFMVFYIIMAAVYFFPVYYLYRFSDFLGKALNTGSEAELTYAFEFLKKHYKFIGILTIISLAFMALAILITILAGAFGLMAGRGMV